MPPSDRSPEPLESSVSQSSPRGGGGKRKSVDPAQTPKRLGNGSKARDAFMDRESVAYPSKAQADRPTHAQPHELHENG